VNIHDYQIDKHGSNRVGSSRLLRLLTRHHGNGVEIDQPAPVINAALVEIKQAVAFYFGISLEEIERSERSEEKAMPRWVFMFLARHAGFKFADIGAALGGLHHASVMHGVDKFTKLALENWTISYDAAHAEKPLHGDAAPSRPDGCPDAPSLEPTDRTGIITAVCRKYSIGKDVFFRGRGAALAARREAIVSLRETGLSKAEIGRAVKVDVSTVNYWLKPAKRAAKQASMKARARAQARRAQA
jgi:hypothetical protein